MDAAVASLRLEQPLPDLARWTAFFRDADIPVLPATALALEDLRANEDEVDANLIGETLAGDPLMTLKVLAHAARHRSSRLVTDAETVTAALLLMGIGPFFRAFGPQRTVQEHLADVPQALAGLQVVLAIRVARHSARGWDNVAIPDDVRDISALLNLGAVPTQKLLLELDS